ncbi:MAG TPA: DUF4235 domain-containing protein [Acidimicrobiales bacterium]|nr:DUF4235 domain-containing protein [Acidimicrobiales bacterium]
MKKIAFLPFSILGSILAGLVAKKLFGRLWSTVDDQSPPQPEERRATWPKLVAGLALEGAVFKAVSGAFDHFMRRVFGRLTGAWPGDESPQPAS